MTVRIANHAPFRNSLKTQRGRETQGPLWVREFREFPDSEDFRDELIVASKL